MREELRDKIFSPRKRREIEWEKAVFKIND